MRLLISIEAFGRAVNRNKIVAQNRTVVYTSKSTFPKNKTITVMWMATYKLMY